jgi:MFS family permease
MAAPGLLLVALANGRSAAQASWMLAAFVGANAVAGPLVGVLLDRARRTAVVLSGAMVCMAVGLLVLVAGMPSWPLWCLCLTAAAAGLAAPLGWP